MLDISGLTFFYPGQARPVIKGLSLRLPPGSITLVTGRSGSGKSTLAGLIMGTLPREGHEDTSSTCKVEGSIKVKGQEMRGRNPYSRAGLVGLVSQDPDSQLCTMSVKDEIAFGPENLCLPRKKIAQRSKWALGTVKASNLMERSTFSLSGGEKQKVTIASIMAMKPDLLVLDEPTASMDPSSTMQLMDVVERLRDNIGTSMLIFEHRTHVFRSQVDHFLELKDGRLVRSDQLIQDVMVQRKGPTITTTTKQKPLLSIKDLWVNREERNVLKGVNLDIYPGQITALMGDNGSGKTTLALSCLNMIPVQKGRVLVKEKDAIKMSTSKLALDIGFVFQNPNSQIFGSTVEEEVLIGPRSLGMDMEASMVKANELLKDLDLHRYRNHSPQVLSHGEKRRLNLASALVHDPGILILDEVFVGQDLGFMESISKLLQKQAECGKGILLILHDPVLARIICHRVAFLGKGKLLLHEPVGQGLEKLSKMCIPGYSKEVWGE